LTKIVLTFRNTISHKILEEEKEMTKIVLKNNRMLLSEIAWNTVNGCLIEYNNKMVQIPSDKIERIEVIPEGCTIFDTSYELNALKPEQDNILEILKKMK
jgi:hypothetical protein